MVSYVAPFRIKSADLNTLNVQNLNASLNSSTQMNINNNSNIITYNLTSSQILSLLENPIVIVPSPGTGFYNFIDNVNVSINFNSIPYQGESQLSLVYTTSNVNTNSNLETISNEIVDASESRFGNTFPVGITPIPSNIISNINNNSITLICNGRDDFTSGDSTVKLTITYTTYQV